MAASVKCLCVMAFLAIVGIASSNPTDGSDACRNSSPDAEARKLYPCAWAVKDPNVKPTASCCDQVKQLGKSPKCMCAVMMSNTAKSSGVKLEVALTIPKRCNHANRPVGYKCGAYTLP